MPMMPFQILGIWLRGLLAIALLGAGLYLLKEWYDSPRTVVEAPRAVEVDRRDGSPARDEGVRRVVHVSRWHLGLDRPTAFLLGGLALLFATLGGGLWGTRYPKKSEGKPPGAGDPASSSSRGTVHRVRAPDGTELHATCVGPEDAPAIVMTHGWGVDGSEWDWSRDKLASRHRLIIWDLPGLGQSQRPANNDYRLENLAHHLDSITALAGGKPVVLLGHSIGGMINLTYARLFPEKLGTRVTGIIQVHTTYTNPVKTTKWSALYSALQKPLLEPLCHVMIWTAPAVWVMNWMSYFNGSAHRSTDKSSFAGTESREQLDRAARYLPKAWPGVLARGMLAMFRYDATSTLGTISVPTLVITGDRDDTTQPWASGVMAESIPKAGLHTQSPARHMGHMEHHDDFAAAVSSFVDSLGVQAASGAALVENMSV